MQTTRRKQIANFDISAANIAALTAFNCLQNGVAEGTPAYVATVGDKFYFASNYTGTLDGITAVATSLGGTTAWLRAMVPDQRWQNRSFWFLDFASAVTTNPSSDENDGATANTPLKTWAELLRRLSGRSNVFQLPYASASTVPVLARAAASANVVLSGLQTVDTVALLPGNRVLLSAQADPLENGIWIVSAGAWTRAPDMALGTHAGGVPVWVTSGPANGSQVWVSLAVPPADVVGTNNLAFASSFAGSFFGLSPTIVYSSTDPGVVSFNYIGPPVSCVIQPFDIPSADAGYAVTATVAAVPATDTPKSYTFGKAVTTQHYLYEPVKKLSVKVLNTVGGNTPGVLLAGDNNMVTIGAAAMRDVTTAMPVLNIGIISSTWVGVQGANIIVRGAASTQGPPPSSLERFFFAPAWAEGISASGAGVVGSLTLDNCIFNSSAIKNCDLTGVTQVVDTTFQCARVLSGIVENDANTANCHLASGGADASLIIYNGATVRMSNASGNLCNKNPGNGTRSGDSIRIEPGGVLDFSSGPTTHQVYGIGTTSKIFALRPDSLIISQGVGLTTIAGNIFLATDTASPSTWCGPITTPASAMTATQGTMDTAAQYAGGAFTGYAWHVQTRARIQNQS